MTAITLAQLENASLDANHIADIATSALPTAVDRLGRTKETMRGAIDSIKSVTSRGAWVTATDYIGKDLVSNDGTWYICVTAHTASAAFATDAAKWRVYQGALAENVLERKPRSSKGLLIGDSIVAAYLGQDALDTYLLSDADALSGTTITNQAVPGQTILQQQTVWTADANKDGYDWIFIQIGINDVYFTETSAAIIARYQTLINAVNSGKKDGAVVLIGTMTPLLMTGSPLQQWRDLNESIMGGGATPITGVDYRVNKHTAALNNGLDALATIYDIGDTIHPLNNGRAVIAECWREAIQGCGFLTPTPHGEIEAPYVPRVFYSYSAAVAPISLYNKAGGNSYVTTQYNTVGAGGTWTAGVGNSTETVHGLANKYFIFNGEVRFSIDPLTGVVETPYGLTVGGELSATNGKFARLTGYGGDGVSLNIKNVALGPSALNSVASGAQFNTALGELSLQAETNADQNTAVGYASLYSNNGGADNTAVGFQAGFGSAGTANTTGSNNTFIGKGSAGASQTASNVVTLGNASIATLRCQVTSITALSDARDKTDISPLKFGLDFINSLNPVSFTWNTRDGAKVGIKACGFLAQDLDAAEAAASAADVLNLVSHENPEKLEATYGHLIPVLVKAIQDLSAEIEALKNLRG